jgi:O-antigen biosynthesis protein
VALPFPWSSKAWTPHWKDPLVRLEAVESNLRAMGAYAHRGGEFDRWDFEVRGGMFGTARILTVAEDQPKGSQLVRCRLWPRITPFGVTHTLLFGLLSAGALWGSAWIACVLLSMMTFLLASRTWLECGAAMAAIRRAVQLSGDFPEAPNREPG